MGPLGALCSQIHEDIQDSCGYESSECKHCCRKSPVSFFFGNILGGIPLKPCEDHSDLAQTYTYMIRVTHLEFLQEFGLEILFTGQYVPT